jgi:hypothetical protein
VPPGAIFHWVVATDDGMRVVDVWEDRATLTSSPRRRSARSAPRSGPRTQKLRSTQFHNTLAQ